MSLQRTISSSLKTLEGSAPIAKISTRHLEKLPLAKDNSAFTLALQFCPLYVIHGKSFNEGADLLKKDLFTEEDINSLPGIREKWQATQIVVLSLKQLSAALGAGLTTQVTFGDMGVIVSKRDYICPEALEKQSELYRTCFERFCRQNEIGFSFRNLSDFDQSELDPESRVEQYIVVNEYEPLKKVPHDQELLQLLGLKGRIDIRTPRGKKAVEIFQKRLEMSEFNLGVTKAFVHTYLTLLPKGTEGADMQLGMEVADIFFALTSAEPSSRQSNMPTINVLVSYDRQKLETR